MTEPSKSGGISGKVIRKTIAVSAVYVFLVFVICFSGYRIAVRLFDYRLSAETYRKFAESYTCISDDPEDDEDNTKITVFTPETNSYFPLQKDPDTVCDDGTYPIKTDFENLLSENPDVTGWIYLPDSKINYPVVIADDNDYYLHRRIDREYSFGGTIFMDTADMSDWSSRNTILYGHNMNDGSMFAGILKYKQQETYDKQPCLYLDTPDGRYRLDIFSGFVTDAESEAYRTAFPDEESFYCLVQ